MSDCQQTASGDADMKFKGVFKSLEAVQKCLRSDKYVSLPEVQKLLKIYNDCCSKSYKEIPNMSERKPFIVLEGMDASGKTTISKKLATLLGGRRLSTPPSELLTLRKKFDNHEMELRRAYYALGNYIAAEQVKQIYQTKPVVMDRFWHSTAAYAIASSGSTPAEGHEVYQWPGDLLKPDVVFFLDVSEHTRIERLMTRKSKPVTLEEVQMKDDKILRNRILDAFLRMEEPKLESINADIYPKRAVKLVESALASKGMLNPAACTYEAPALKFQNMKLL